MEGRHEVEGAADMNLWQTACAFIVAFVAVFLFLVWCICAGYGAHALYHVHWGH